MTVPECPVCAKPVTPHESVVMLQCGWYMAKRGHTSGLVIYHVECFRTAALGGALLGAGSPVGQAMSIFPSQRGLGL